MMGGALRPEQSGCRLLVDMDGAELLSPNPNRLSHRHDFCQVWLYPLPPGPTPASPLSHPNAREP